MKWNTVGLFVENMETIVSFYRDVMKLETTWNGEPNADLMCGAMRLILFGRKDFEAMTSQSYSYPTRFNGTMELAFEADNYQNVDQLYEETVKLGAQPIFPPTTMPWGQRTCYIADPEGNLIEISSFQKD